MRYFVTFVQMSRATRRRVGKSKIVLVEQNTLNPSSVEEKFEREWEENNPGSFTTVKVIDVVSAERAGGER